MVSESIVKRTKNSHGSSSEMASRGEQRAVTRLKAKQPRKDESDDGSQRSDDAESDSSGTEEDSEDEKLSGSEYDDHEMTSEV